MVTKLREAAKKAVETDQFKKAIGNLGDDVAYLDQPEFAKFWDAGRQARRGRGAVDRQGARLNRHASDADTSRASEHDPARDHIAGGAFIAARHSRFRHRAATCRSARLSSPGAGMMPKLLPALMIAFAAIIIMRVPTIASRSPRSHWGDWQPCGGSARGRRRSRPLLYSTLGFLLTHAAAGVHAAGRGRAPQPLSPQPSSPSALTLFAYWLFGKLLKVAA